MADYGTYYLTSSQKQREESAAALSALIQQHHVTLISIGNGTASYETEQFISSLIRDNGLTCRYCIANEAGASVYSASDLAREELPELDVSIRGAVSIARRIQDPLAELVKIDPKSIGVGQYQHDVNQKRLSATLDDVVESVVNYVGVDLNTASPALLQHISGLTASTAGNIVAYRNENGPFHVVSLDELPVGTIVRGTVHNVVDFGAFVDIGLKTPGLIHRSELSSHSFTHPLDIIHVGDIIDAVIISVDAGRSRIGLSIKQLETNKSQK